MLGDFVAGEDLPAVVDDVLFREGLSGFRRDEGLGDFAAALVGDALDGALEHVGVRLDGVLDFFGPNVFAGDDHHVGAAAGDVEVAVGVEPTDVACLEEASGQERGPGEIRGVVVSFSDAEPFDADLACLAAGEFTSGVGVHDAHVDVAQGRSDGPPAVGAEAIDGDDGGGLGKTVAIENLDAEPLAEGVADGGGEGLAARDDVRQARQVRRDRGVGAGEHRLVERRNRHHHRRAPGLDSPEGLGRLEVPNVDGGRTVQQRQQHRCRQRERMKERQRSHDDEGSVEADRVHATGDVRVQVRGRQFHALGDALAARRVQERRQLRARGTLHSSDLRHRRAHVLHEERGDLDRLQDLRHRLAGHDAVELCVFDDVLELFGRQGVVDRHRSLVHNE